MIFIYIDIYVFISNLLDNIFETYVIKNHKLKTLQKKLGT